MGFRQELLIASQWEKKKSRLMYFHPLISGFSSLRSRYVSSGNQQREKHATTMIRVRISCDNWDVERMDMTTTWDREEEELRRMGAGRKLGCLSEGSRSSTKYKLSWPFLDKDLKNAINKMAETKWWKERKSARNYPSHAVTHLLISRLRLVHLHSILAHRPDLHSNHGISCVEDDHRNEVLDDDQVHIVELPPTRVGIHWEALRWHFRILNKTQFPHLHNRCRIVIFEFISVMEQSVG